MFDLAPHKAGKMSVKSDFSKTRSKHQGVRHALLTKSMPQSKRAYERHSFLILSAYTRIIKTDDSETEQILALTPYLFRDYAKKLLLCGQKRLSEEFPKRNQSRVTLVMRIRFFWQNVYDEYAEVFLIVHLRRALF